MRALAALALLGLALPSLLLLRSFDRAMERAVHAGLTLDADDEI
ncbi:MAG: hypothetical protein PVI57_06875 [Gemmatimonadota bacterium]